MEPTQVTLSGLHSEGAEWKEKMIWNLSRKWSRKDEEKWAIDQYVAWLTTRSQERTSSSAAAVPGAVMGQTWDVEAIMPETAPASRCKAVAQEPERPTVKETDTDNDLSRQQLALQVMVEGTPLWEVLRPSGGSPCTS